MATRKKKATKTRATKSKLPKGYKSITGFADSWPGTNPKTGASIEGTIKEFGHFMTEDKDPKTKKIVKRKVLTCTIIEKKSGEEKRVVESAGLRPLFKLKKGTKVFIAYTGKLVISKGKNPMRTYDIGAM